MFYEDCRDTLETERTPERLLELDVDGRALLGRLARQLRMSEENTLRFALYSLARGRAPR